MKNIRDGKYVDVEPGDLEIVNDPDVIAAEVRGLRDSLLRETDWRFRSDMTPSVAWVDYCQALRDVPQQAGFPENVKWPEKP